MQALKYVTEEQKVQQAVEVTIFRLEYLSHKKKKPFFCQASHVKAWFSSERHLQFLFQIHLLTSNLKHVYAVCNRLNPTLNIVRKMT